MIRIIYLFALLSSGFVFGEIQTTTSLKDVERSTYARFVPERLDDFAWENDLIAFRSYGPGLRAGAENAGIDCWLKRVPYPIIDKWYDQALNHGKSYHKDHGEGLDNYHVGSTAGCGGTSLWVNGQRRLFETFTQWKILEAAPEKTVFALTFENEIDGTSYKEIKKITIELGKRLFKAESTFWKDGELAVGLPIAIGVATHDGAADTLSNSKAGWIACWEMLDGSGLGTGVLLHPKDIISTQVIEPIEKDLGHIVAITETDAAGQIVYYTGYGWQKAGAITTVGKWRAYLNDFAKRIREN